MSGLYAFKYTGQAFDELERLLDEWNNPAVLEDFFEQYENDLHYFGTNVESATIETINEATRLSNLLLALSGHATNSLHNIFRPLDDTEYKSILLSKQKAKRGWLRLYSIKIDINHYVITGGAIKLTHQMQDRPHTQSELTKLERCKNFLRSNGVFDSDSFNEMTV